jgi:ligand-binding SRPBCC domain-containing protein
MKVYTLKRKQSFALSLQDVFEFFGKPENLEEITPRSVGFHILTPRPIKIKVGTVLDYTIRLFGISVRWTTLISEYDPPNRFSDVAIRGPYSFWFHTHTFKTDNGKTIMKDEVSYALPFGFIGRLAHFLWVKRQLNYIFDYRAQVISDILEGKNVPTSVLDQTDSNQENI